MSEGAFGVVGGWAGGGVAHALVLWAALAGVGHLEFLADVACWLVDAWARGAVAAASGVHVVRRLLFFVFFGKKTKKYGDINF